MIKSKTPEYVAWVDMKRRCYQPSRPFYKDYGGRGISVCPRWLESFDNFLEDMGNRPKGMTLDRIDNDGNYEPSNCRWISIKEQNRNRRNTRNLTVGCVTLSVYEWAKELSMTPEGIYYRLDKLKWSPEKVISTPNRKGYKETK